MRHDGRVIEDVIRKREVNLSELAIKLAVSRGNLYTWFKSAQLRSEVVHRIGKTIGYDFSVDFPDMAGEPDHQRQRKSLNLHGDIDYKDKYVELLEKFRLLLEKRSSVSDDSMIAYN
jgi:hypothetical protein